jgi:hypothetical protein
MVNISIIRIKKAHARFFGVFVLAVIVIVGLVIYSKPATADFSTVVALTPIIYTPDSPYYPTIPDDPPGYVGANGEYILRQPVACGGGADISANGAASAPGQSFLMHQESPGNLCDGGCEDAIARACSDLAEGTYQDVKNEAKEECESLSSSLPGGAAPDPATGEPIVDFACRCTPPGKQTPGTECDPSSGWDPPCTELGFGGPNPAYASTVTVQGTAPNRAFTCEIASVSVNYNGVFSLACNMRGCVA